MKTAIPTSSSNLSSPAWTARHNDRSPLGREWIYGGSSARAAAVATATGAAVFGAGFLLGSALLGRQRPKAALAVADMLSGLLAGTLVFDALRHARKRRVALLGRDAVILQMNHHVRNALQSIALTAHVSPDDSIEPAIQAAIERIQWALREVLPQESWR